MGATTVELTDRDEPEELEREVEDIRENIDDIVGELDRRGHELFDWRSHLRRNKALLLTLGASCLVGFGLTISLGVAKRRRQARLSYKARQLRRALSRMVAHPELVAQPRPGVANKALSAAVGAVAGGLARAIVRRLVEASEPPRLTAHSE
jgi:hypothetical protein